VASAAVDQSQAEVLGIEMERLRRRTAPANWAACIAEACLALTMTSLAADAGDRDSFVSNPLKWTQLYGWKLRGPLEEVCNQRFICVFRELRRDRGRPGAFRRSKNWPLAS
jgi:hypothetical protein